MNSFWSRSGLWLVVVLVALGCSGRAQDPEGNAAEGPTPEEATPEEATPEEATPEEATPEEATPGASTDPTMVPLTRTNGDRRRAIGAVRGALWLVKVVDQRSPADADELAVRLAFSGGDITFLDSSGLDPTLPSPFWPTTARSTGSASCTKKGCTYDDYILFTGLGFGPLNGSLLLSRYDDGRSLKIDLVFRDLDTVVGPTTISGELAASATGLSGTIGASTADRDDSSAPTEVQLIRFQDVGFDEATDPGAVVPTSGSLYAQWQSPGGHGNETTLAFP